MSSVYETIEADVTRKYGLKPGELTANPGVIAPKQVISARAELCDRLYKTGTLSRLGIAEMTGLNPHMVHYLLYRYKGPKFLKEEGQ